MQVSDIVEGIIAKKRELGMTAQQLADSSGVPKSTIDRIIRQDTPNPTLQTVLDLAAAVGYTFSNHPEHDSVPTATGLRDPMIQHMIAVYEKRDQRYEEQLKANTAHYNRLLAEKNRWLKCSMMINIILVALVCFVLILDVLHPDIGWIREQLAKYSHTGGFEQFSLFAERLKGLLWHA